MGFKAVWARPQDVFGICTHGDGQPFARLDVSTEDRWRQRLVDHDFQGVVFNFAFPGEALHHIHAGRVRVGNANIDFQPRGREVVGPRPLVQSIFNGVDVKFKRVAQARMQLLVGCFIFQRAIVREIPESGSRRSSAVDDAQVKWGGRVLDAGGGFHSDLTFQRCHLCKHPIGVAWNHGKVGCRDHAGVAIEEKVTLSPVGHHNVQTHGLACGAHEDGRHGSRAFDAGQLGPSELTTKPRRLPHGHRGRSLDECRGSVQNVLVGFPRLEGGHPTSIDRDLSAVFDSQNLEPVVSSQVAMHCDVFRPENVVRDDLIPHQVGASSKSSPAARIVVHGDGHR